MTSNHIFLEREQLMNIGLLINEKSNQFSIFGPTERQLKLVSLTE